MPDFKILHVQRFSIKLRQRGSYLFVCDLEEVPVSIPAVAARSLLVRSVSV